MYTFGVNALFASRKDSSVLSIKHQSDLILRCGRKCKLNSFAQFFSSSELVRSDENLRGTERN